MSQYPTSSDWRALWAEYGPKLLLFARQLTEASADAEDLIQEAFIRFWKAREANPSLTPPLLFTMVRRSAVDHARKCSARRAREGESQVTSGDSYFDLAIEEKERRTVIEQSLRQLPSTQREVLVLKIWGELTFEEIGEALEISPFTAASRYRYAIQQLRGVLAPAEV